MNNDHSGGKKNMGKRLTGAVSYITIIGWIIAFVLGDRKGAKVHLNQSLVIVVANLILTIVAKVLGGIAIVSTILWVLDIILFVLMILGFIRAIMGNDKPLPIIGGIKILK